MQEYEVHPYAMVFPPMKADDSAALIEDIGRVGLREPIILYNGAILDGRNRYRACINAAVKPHFTTFEGTDDEALDLVFSKNFARRHLDESQRAMVSARRSQMMAERAAKEEANFVANLPQKSGRGRPSKGAGAVVNSDKAAAKSANVSERSTRKARKVIDKGTPELVAAVDDGKLSVDAAAKIADLPPDEQKHVLADPTPETAIKKVARKRKEEALAAKQCALPADRFGVIYADPEWSFETYSENGKDRSADNHYPTSPTEEICKRDVPSMAADDCVLFLWATVPMLPDALRVMEAWGFAYKSQFVWLKNKPGTGYWNRNQHELLLVGTRGKIPAPAPGDQWLSIVTADAGRHSEKPATFYDLIEAYFPNLPKIELNARGPARKGWAVWGNEAQADAEDEREAKVNRARSAPKRKAKRAASANAARTDITDEEIRRNLDKHWEKWPPILSDAEEGSVHLLAPDARKAMFFDAVRKGLAAKGFAAKAIDDIAQRFWREALSRLGECEVAALD